MDVMSETGNTGTVIAEAKEQWSLKGEELVEKVKELIHEGNVRRIIIKHNGHTIVEIPVTFGVIGMVISPTLAAVGAIATIISNCTVEVVRTDEPI
jgi:type II secretory pathway component PulC